MTDFAIDEHTDMIQNKLGMDITTNLDPITDDEFDYQSYENSWTNRLKQCWVVFQCCLMVVFMVIGVRHYNRILQRWSKYNSLFVLQTVAIFYLAINEFTGRNIHGIFLIYLLTQYCLFLTFCIVLDSNLTDDQITNW